METANLKLIENSPEQLRVFLKGSDAYFKAYGIRIAESLLDLWRDVPREHIDRMLASKPGGAWAYGYSIVHKADNILIGSCGFKSPPDADAHAEIAYGIAATYQGKGYATETVRMVVEHFFKSGELQKVSAHTLPQENASTAVLKKCGFQKVGEVIDPDDGPVWRWERLR